MKRIFQKNQVILTALAIMIAIAGYLNFTNDDDNSSVKVASNEKTASENNDSEDEDVLFDISEEDVLNENSNSSSNNDASNEEETEETSGDADATSDNTSQIGEVILVNSTIEPDAIYTAKLSREQERAKNKETLLAIVDDDSASQEMKDKALNEILDITANAEKELSAETLLAAKGYENAIVSISEDSTDVIVDVDTITQDDATVIMDVVKRKTGTQSSKIVISPVNSDSGTETD